LAQISHTRADWQRSFNHRALRRLAWWRSTDAPSPASRGLPDIYTGELTATPAVVGDYCLACSERVLGPAEAACVSAAVLAFSREVNATIVDHAGPAQSGQFIRYNGETIAW
jgi:hypothetical protein